MIIGIPKETRRHESRVSLVPREVATLVNAGHEVRIQADAGVGAGFSAGNYEQAGATASNGLGGCDLIVGVKAPQLSTLRAGAAVMAYLHVEKGQNADLLKRLRKGRFLSYAFEEIRDENAERVVNLGFEAGTVGILEGLRIYGELLAGGDGHVPLQRLIPAAGYASVKEVYSEVSQLGPIHDVNVVIMGKGCVSRGVRALLELTNIAPQVLWRDQTVNIEKYLPDVDILVNAVDWYPGDPHIVKKTALRLMKKTALIVDISCDTSGAVESCIPTTWDDPVYTMEGITHFCVSNLPSAIPHDSSIHLSEMILPHVMKVAGGEQLDTGKMTEHGQFVYQAPLE